MYEILTLIDKKNWKVLIEYSVYQKNTGLRTRFWSISKRNYIRYWFPVAIVSILNNPQGINRSRCCISLPTNKSIHLTYATSECRFCSGISISFITTNLLAQNLPDYYIW